MVLFRLFNFVILILFLGVIELDAQEYIPDEALRTQIREKVWNRLKVKTPKKQRFLTSLVFNTNQCFDLFEKAADQRGWPSYAPTTVLAFRQVVIEEAIMGRDYTESEIVEVYEATALQLKRENAGTPLSNKQLQEKYDPLILESLWIGTLTEFIKGRNDDAKNLALQMKDVPMEKPTQVREPSSMESKDKEDIPRPLTVNNDMEVEDIILRTVTNYGLNGVYTDNEVSVLFKNGDLFTNPSKPLNQINVADSKRKNPKKWATWKKRGNVLYVTKSWKNKTYDWKKWFELRPGKKGMKLAGTFNTLDAFGGDRVINASIVSFDSRGRFAWKTIKGGDTPWTPVYSKSSSAGRYLIYNHSITLNYNNGQTETFFFGLYPKDNEHFVIGVGHFTPK